MNEKPHDLIETLVMAHRILVREGVLDAFGHASVRDPSEPYLFWLGRALPPSRLQARDFLAFNLDGAPVPQTDQPLFAERYIHAEVFRSRSDVQAVCHHHAPALMPFCVGSQRFGAISQTGAFLGEAAPLWNSADEFGATRMLVDDAKQASSLARALGERSLVLMRGHGAVVVGRGIEEMVFKAIYACREAEAYRAAIAFGPLTPLSRDEIDLCGEPGAPAIRRGWSHWTQAIDSDGMTGVHKQLP